MLHNKKSCSLYENLYFYFFTNNCLVRLHTNALENYKYGNVFYEAIKVNIIIEYYNILKIENALWKNIP